MKSIIIRLFLMGAAFAAPATNVYVWDSQTGDVNIYDSVPVVDLPESVHVEYLEGHAVDNDHHGHVDYSTDGTTEPYTYISYNCMPVEEGDKVKTILIYNAPDGEWEDDIVYRFDIIEED